METHLRLVAMAEVLEHMLQWPWEAPMLKRLRSEVMEHTAPDLLEDMALPLATEVMQDMARRHMELPAPTAAVVAKVTARTRFAMKKTSLRPICSDCDWFCAIRLRFLPGARHSDDLCSEYLPSLDPPFSALGNVFAG